MYEFPWTNLHELNLDWLLKTVKDIDITQQDIDDIKDIYAQFGPYTFPTVKSYGAVGDGVTDDTQAILDCIADQDVVIFPYGTYYIGSQLEVPNLQGKILMGFPYAHLDCSDYRPAITYSENIRLQNMVCTGGTPSCFTFYLTKNIEVSNCVFSGGTDVCLEFSNCGDTRVSNCEIMNAGTNTGLSFSTAAAYVSTEFGANSSRIVENCHCHHNGLDGIIANTYNVSISNCICDYNGTYTKAAGIYANSVYGISITGCKVDSNTGNGIDMVKTGQISISDTTAIRNECAGIFMGACYNSAISGCHCFYNGSDPIDAWQDSGFVFNIYDGTGCNNILLTNCTSTSNVQYGYRYRQCANMSVFNDFAYGNSSGQHSIEGSIYRADSSVVTTSD